MLKRIYRFEVDREAARDNRSVVYDARDQLDDSPVTLYEWAPDAVDPTATDRFSQAIPSLQDVEAFNSETHFYIAAKSPNSALSALRILRGLQLFTGSWPGIAAPPPPPPPVPTPVPVPPPPVPTPAPVPPVPAPAPIQPGTGNAKVLWASLSVILAIGGVLGYLSYQRRQEEPPKKVVVPSAGKPLVSVPKKGMFDRGESLPATSPVVPAHIPDPAPAPFVPPAEKVLAVCLQNPTNVDIVYQLSWSGQRETKTLKKGESQLYETQPRVLLEFRVDFDNNFAPGYTGTRLVLPANEVDAPADCAKARQYSFSTKGQQIGLTARTWTPGFNHPFAANVVQSTKEGSWVPSTGFRWYNPQDPSDLNVVPTDSGLIGVAVSTDGKSKYCTISSVRPDGPAAKVNLHAGLEIHRVGGMVASGWTVDQCKTAIRGPINSSVSIEVYDPTLNMSYTVNVLRQ